MTEPTLSSLSFLHLFLTLLSLFLSLPPLYCMLLIVANTMLNTRNKVLNNLEADTTCISNQGPIKFVLTSCAQGTCNFGQRGVVEVEGESNFKGRPVCPKLSRAMNENYRQLT